MIQNTYRFIKFLISFVFWELWDSQVYNTFPEAISTFSRQLQNTLASPQYAQRSMTCQSPIKVWKVLYSQQELELVIWTSITNPSRKSAFFFYSNFSILLFSASIPVFEILSLIQYKLFKDGKLWGMVCLPLPFIISDKEVLVCLSRVFLAIMAV